MGGEELKWRKLLYSLIHFSPHRKAKAKRPNLLALSHVAFASVLLGEKPSEEVDDFDNYYYNEFAETTALGGRQNLLPLN